MRRVPLNDLVSFGTMLLEAKGVPSDDARYIAEAAVKTEAMGVVTHGLKVLLYLAAGIPDDIPPRIEPEVVRERGAVVLIDARGGVSQTALRKALGFAQDKARAYGVAMAAVRNARWLGALGVHIVPLAEKGFFAMMWGQNSRCRDSAPVGGIEPTFSTNPVALAFPADPRPVMADMSTSAVSMGKVSLMISRGEKAQDKIFMDKDGNLSDDPRVVKDGGSILFTGGARHGHKGYAFSLWAEALTAMVGGSCNNPEKEQRQTLNLTVIDPDAFGCREYYEAEMKRFISRVKASRLRPGVDAIRLPGERAFDCLDRAEREGVPVTDEVLEKLNAAAAEAGIASLG